MANTRKLNFLKVQNNKITTIILSLALTFAPVTSSAIYTLSAFYTNAQQLVYSYIGAVYSGPVGYVSGAVFTSGSADNMFNSPGGVVADAVNDRMYVADQNNNRISKFVMSTGAFIGSIGNTSVASGTCTLGTQATWCTGGTFTFGTTDGGFNGPRGMAADLTNDFLFVNDVSNGRVQKFVLSTGAFVGAIGKSSATGTCLSGKQNGWCTGGTFVVGSTGDGIFGTATGIAADVTRNRLYVGDTSGQRVHQFNLATGAFIGSIGKSTATGTCVAGKQTGWCTGGTFSFGSGDGNFLSPQAVALDETNNFIYVTDVYYRVQKFVASTGAFVGTVGKSTAAGTCVAGKQNGWCTGGTFSTGTGDGMFSSPSQAVADAVHDRLYVVDANRIQQFVLSTGAFLGLIGGTSTASGTCVAGKQTAWCTGATTIVGGRGDGYFTNVQWIAIDTTNNKIYVTDSISSKLQVFSSAGAFVGALGKTVMTLSNWSQAVAGTSNGPAEGMFNAVASVAVDTANNLMYATDTGNFRVVKLNLATGAFIGAIGNATSLAPGSTCVLGKQTNWCTGGTFASSGINEGIFTNPVKVIIDVTGNLMYVADSGNGKIQKFTLSTGAFIGAIGYSTTTAGTCVAGKQAGWCAGGSITGSSIDGGINQVNSMAIDFVHNGIFVVDYNKRVQKFTLSTGAFVGAIGNSTATGTCVAGKQTGWCTGGTFSWASTDGGFYFETSVVVDPINDFLYVGESANTRVQKFVGSTGAFVGAIGKSAATGTCVAGVQTAWCTGGTFAAGSGDGEFVNGGILGIDTVKGFLFVGDYSGRIQKFNLSTGVFIGAIGNSTASGTCLKGKQKNWCSGGTYSQGTQNGFIGSISDIVVDSAKNRMFIADSGNSRIQKISW